MLQGAVELGYRRQMMLLAGRMRVRLLGEGMDERQVVCLDGGRMTLRRDDGSDDNGVDRK